MGKKKKNRKSGPFDRSDAVTTKTVPSTWMEIPPNVISKAGRRKWYDVDLGAIGNTVGVAEGNISSITTTGSVFSPGGNIAAGADRTNRVGRMISLHAIRFKGYFEAGAENLLFNGDLNNIIRVSLFRLQDPQPFATAGAVLNSVWAVGSYVVAHMQRDFVAEVYYDRLLPVRTTLATAASSSQKQGVVVFDIEFPGQGLPITYDAAVVGSESYNQVIFAVASDSSAIPHPSGAGVMRVEFSDLQP